MPQNKRNGTSQKTVKGESGEFEIEISRDREGEFEPQLVKKHQRRLAGLDQKILSLYAQGLSTRDIQAEIQDMYGVELSPTLEAVYPRSKIQLCIVHMIRNSTKFVNWKDRKPLCVDLKQVYQATTINQAETVLLEFGEKWDKKYPNISQMWQRYWEDITTFFAYPEDIRRVIYTTNAIQSLNMTVRKVIKNKR